MVLALMITKQCNFHCGHCMVDSTHDFSLVSPAIIDRYFHMLETVRPDEVYLLGGEPFLHIDTVELIVNRTKPVCGQIVVFSNGSFLLDDGLTRRIEDLGVTVRISSDRYHRKSWSPLLEEKIRRSHFWVVHKDSHEEMIPVGRAYQEYRHLQYHMGCSLLTGRYGEEYPNHHRCMIMLDGSVNLYCATVQGSLANVFEDGDITYELLVRREKALHNYLLKHVIHCPEDTYMAALCNRCANYKVTERHILYAGQVVGRVEDYQGYEIDLYEHLNKLPETDS